MLLESIILFASTNAADDKKNATAKTSNKRQREETPETKAEEPEAKKSQPASGIKERDQNEDLATYPGKGVVKRSDLVTFLKLMPNLQTEDKPADIVDDMETHMSALRATMKDFKNMALKEGLKEKYAEEIEAIVDQFLFRKVLSLLAERAVQPADIQKEIDVVKKEIESQKFYDLSLIIADDEAHASSIIKDHKEKKATFEQLVQKMNGKEEIIQLLKRQDGRLSSEPMPAKVIEIILGPENLEEITKNYKGGGVVVKKPLKFRDRVYVVQVNSVHKGAERADAEIAKVKPAIVAKVQQNKEAEVLDKRLQDPEYKIKDTKSNQLKPLKDYPTIMTRIKNMLTGRMGGMGGGPNLG